MPRRKSNKTDSNNISQQLQLQPSAFTFDPTSGDSSPTTSNAMNDHSFTDAYDDNQDIRGTKRAWLCSGFTALAVLIVSAALLSYFAYKVARDQEVKAFESKFQDYANEIIRSSVSNARNTNLVLQSFSRTISSLALFANTTWPYLTVPHYETRADDYIKLTKAESLTYAPVIEMADREAYENYTVRNQGWIEQGLIYEYEAIRGNGGHEQEDDDDYLSDQSSSNNNNIEEEQPQAIVNQEGFSILFQAKPIEPYIWTHAPLTHRAVPDQSKGPYVPIWQTFPAPRTSFVVGNNLLQTPEFEQLIQSSRDSLQPILSDIFDNNFRLFGISQTIDVDPKSVLLQPIFSEIAAAAVERHIVGYMIAIKKWHPIFENVLYGGAEPLDVVLRNSCDKAFTYRVIGTRAYFMGKGNLHHSETSSDIHVTAPLFLSRDLQSTCNYTLTVYPTKEMEQEYHTNLPLLLVVIIWAFCTLLAAGISLYTRTSKIHQTNRLKSEAQQEQARLRIDHARQAAKAERELNEFVAHEVRNPLSAAMSACSFVSSAVQDLSALASAHIKESNNAPQPQPAPKPLFALNPPPSNNIKESNNAQQPQPATLAPTPLFAINPPSSNNSASQQSGVPPKPLFALAAEVPAAPQTKPLFSLHPPATEANGDSSAKPAPLFSIAPSSAPQPSSTTTTNTEKSDAKVQQILEQKESIMEDLHIIDSSLQFINELLRNMLDVQRAAHHQLKIEKVPTDILEDILQPVDAMLYRRGKADVKVILECPENLMVVTDRLRLKQVVLNLSRNSAKFVERGFIRLRVLVVGEEESSKRVQILVEDSGPGIPDEKKGKLFAKFQESLDSLSQGTGLGLSLCQTLITLMGGDVWLDESYDSGVAGCPGARFVIDLGTPPLQLDDDDHDEDISNGDGVQGHTTADNGALEALRQISNKAKEQSMSAKPEQSTKSSSSTSNDIRLPQDLKVLFVDDDTVLRKLFVRSVRRIAPQWKTQEAASGEAALRLADEFDGDEATKPQFDIIFMDQYMASTEKQLLGTETIQALRSKGVRSKICGLSANEMAKDFFAAGANAFVLKPLPAQQDALREVLYDILCRDDVAEHAPFKSRGGTGKPSFVFKPSCDG